VSREAGKNLKACAWGDEHAEQIFCADACGVCDDEIADERDVACHRGKFYIALRHSNSLENTA
jgi:hypothetical protein